MPGQRKAGTVGILVRMQAVDKKKIDDAAAGAGISTSELIRQAVSEHIAKLDRVAKKNE